MESNSTSYKHLYCLVPHRRGNTIMDTPNICQTTEPCMFYPCKSNSKHPPLKLISITIKLASNCQFSFVFVNGIHDNEAVQHER